MKRTVTGMVLSLILILVTGCGGSKSQIARVEFKEQVEPKMALSEQYMQLAVMNATMEGSTGEFDQQKWSSMTADMMQHYLEQARERNNMPFRLVDREHLKLAMGEKDLASAGITDGGDALGAAQVKGANAILTSKVTVKIDKQVGKKRTIDAMSVFGGGWSRGGFGGGGVNSSEVDEEARNITVTCQFQLKDAATNDIIVSHNAMPSQHYEKTKSGFFFGSSKTEADMTPRDAAIGAIIEQQAKEFLCKFIPVVFEDEVCVEHSSNEDSAAGVRALVLEDYEAALNSFKQAIAADQNDHKSLFGAGVACEKLKRYDEARKYYRLAQSLKADNPDYNGAVQRVSRTG